MVRPSTNLLRTTQCILVFAISGALSASFFRVPRSVTPAGMSTTPTAKMAYQICIEITNRVFNDSLLSPNSEDYKKMYDEVNQLLAEVYGCRTCSTGSVYEGVATMTFSHGSVIANATIVFYTEAINQWVVKYLFLENIKANPSALLQINTIYTEFQATPVPAVVPNITITTTPTTTITNTTPMTTTTTTTPLATTTKDPSFDKTKEDPTGVATVSTTIGSGMRNDSARSTSSATSTSSSVITDGSEGNNRTNTTFPPTTSHGASTSPGRVDPEKTSKRSTTSPSGGSTKHPLKPSTRPQSSTTTKSSTTANVASGGNGGGFSDWVPGWAIALLVLAAVILLLLIIIFIMMVVHWCCKKSKDEKKSTPNIVSFPGYVSHGPQAPIQEQPNGKTFETIQDNPRTKNKTGMYIVNP